MLSLRVTVVLFATLCCVAWHGASADGVGNQFDAIVQQGVGADACFRMVNADAAVGCSSTSPRVLLLLDALRCMSPSLC